MYLSNNDAISALLHQQVIKESEGFDYRDQELEQWFDHIFQLASNNLSSSGNSGEAIPVAFFIHSNPGFLAMACGKTPYITISKGIVERLNYAIPEDYIVPRQLNGIREITGKELRTVLLENCLAFVYYHEKAHITDQIQPVDIFEDLPRKEDAKTVGEFDEDLTAVDSIFSDGLRRFDIAENAEMLATSILTGLTIFFMAMAQTADENEYTLTPPVHLRYASCMLQVFKCLKDKGTQFTKSDIQRIILNAEQSCRLIASEHLEDNINRLYVNLKDTVNLKKDLDQFAGESSRYSLLDLSILEQII